MKKSIVVFIALFFVKTVIAQENKMLENASLINNEPVQMHNSPLPFKNIIRTSDNKQIKVITDSTVNYNFFTETDSVPTSKSIYLYDSRGLGNQTFEYEWTGSEWSMVSKWDILMYNETIPEYFVFYKLESDQFVPSWKYSYEFEPGLDSSFTQSYYKWDISKQDWTPSGKSIEHFSNSQKISNESFGWEETWVPSSKAEYTYNELPDNDYTVTSFMYDTDLKSFVNSDKTEVTVNEDGKEDLYMTYKWSKGLSDWILNRKSDYEYDEVGNRSAYESLTWNSIAWNGSLRVEYEYDGNGWLKSSIESRESDWDYNAQAWDGYSTRTLKFYDESGNVKLSVNYSWSESGNTWKLNSKTYHYTSVMEVSGIEPLKEQEISCYSNPYSDYVLLNMNDLNGYKLDVWSVNGRKLFTQDLRSGSNTVNMADHAPGLYIFKVSNDKEMSVLKVLIK